MSKDLILKVASMANLILSWRKVENALHKGEIWFDELDAFDFKLNLTANLQSIHNNIVNGCYRLHPILPAPYPKGPKTDVNGKIVMQVRQAFYVNIRDQVTWMALYNIVGPMLEMRMPAWSYGNRMGLTFWKTKKKDKDTDKEEDVWIHGPYRRTSPYFYMKWTHSWPLYRRRITFSIKRMAHVEEEDYEETDIRAETEEENENIDYLKLKYLEKNYFKGHGKYSRLYWLGMDLTKFYQDVNMEHVAELICKYADGGYEASFQEFVKSICKFEVDMSMFKAGDEQYARDMQLDAVFTGLPTGLFVAGAIANLYLLEIDMIVDKKLDTNKDILHFRYVDDHVFVGTDPLKLYSWVKNYINLIQKDNYVHVNMDKFDPMDVKELFLSKKEPTENVIRTVFEDHCSLNPQYPSPLMTQSLMKVSQIEKLDMGLLTKNEFNIVMTDLKEMLVTDIPEQEIKKVTRISFACSLIARLDIQSEVDYEKIHQLKREWYDYIIDEKKKAEAKSKEHKADPIYDELMLLLWDKHISKGPRDRESTLGIDTSKQKEIEREISEGEKRDRQKRKSILNLLYKSIEELPERNKVWLRAYQYALKYMPQELNQLFNKLDRLRKDKKIHQLTFEYLDSMLASLQAESIIRIIQSLESNDITDKEDENKKKDQLKSLIAIREARCDRYYSHISYLMLHKAKSIYNLFCNKYGMGQINGIADYKESVIGGSKKILDKSYWILWGLWKANGMRLRDPMQFNAIFGQFPDLTIHSKDEHAPMLFLTLLNSDVKNLSTLFKGCFKNQDFRTRLQNLVHANELKFVMYEKGMDEGLIKVLDNAFVKKIKRLSSLTKGYRVLPEWIDWMNNQKDKTESGLDVWKSEYLAVKLMIAIVEKLQELSTDGNRMFHLVDINIHPTNIFINKKQEKIDWHECLSDSFKFDVTILEGKGLVPSDDYIYPNKLFPDIEFGFLEQRHFVYGLGLIFLQLLSKRKTLPWIMSRPEYGFEWNLVLNKLLDDGKISSCNYLLLKGCLSPSSTEAYIMNNLNNDSKDDVVWRDGELVLSLDDFQKRLKKNEKLLHNNVVSLLEQRYCQIIEIDLL